MDMAQVLTLAGTTSSIFPSVSLRAYKLEPVSEHQVLVKFHVAPINPLDIYVIKGLYPVKPQHQYNGEPILGFDGVGEVVEVGEAVRDLARGDFVVPKDYGLGTWRSHAVLDAGKVQRIPRPKDIRLASILKLGILPAYLLIEDLVTLKPGDWVIMNAGTSVVSQFVVQFAHQRGAYTISVIRDRSDADATAVKPALRALGADLILTESELVDATLTTKRVVLALDSVFGSSGQLLLKSLSPGGTYAQLGLLGGAAGKVELSTGDLFARRIQLKGFRGSAQIALRSAQEQLDLLAWFVNMLNSGRLVPPCLGLESVAWDTKNPEKTHRQILEAVEKAERGEFGQRKVLMLFE